MCVCSLIEALYSKLEEIANRELEHDWILARLLVERNSPLEA
jgi:rubrerythrin